VITLPCDIKISALYSFVSSQSTRVPDRQTDGRTDGQNYDPQDRASIAASRGKNRTCIFHRHKVSNMWFCLHAHKILRESVRVEEVMLATTITFLRKNKHYDAIVLPGNFWKNFSKHWYSIEENRPDMVYRTAEMCRSAEIGAVNSTVMAR